jgi:hypothetical protein
MSNEWGKYYLMIITFKKKMRSPHDMPEEVGTIITRIKMGCKTIRPGGSGFPHPTPVDLPVHRDARLSIGGPPLENEINVQGYGNLASDQELTTFVQDLEQRIGPNINNIYIKYAQGHFPDGFQSGVCAKGDPAYRTLTERFARTVKAVIAKRAGRETLCERLLREGVPPERLDLLMTAIERMGAETVNVWATNTFSGLVMQCATTADAQYPNQTVYVKVTPHKAMIEREGRYLRDAWQHQPLRPITAKCLDSIIIPEYPLAALVTLGTKNQGSVPVEDLMEYLKIRTDCFTAFARKTNTGLDVIEQDPFCQDMFNRALAHVYMATHCTNTHYHLPIVPIVSPYSRIDDRLADGSNMEATRAVLELMPLYRIIEQRLHHYASLQPTTIIHRDARLENIWPNADGIRVLGDAGFAQAGRPEQDLAQMESPHLIYYTNMYALFREHIEKGENGRERAPFNAKDRAHTLRQPVQDLAFAHAMRVAAWKIKKGADPTRHIALARCYATSIL